VRGNETVPYQARDGFQCNLVHWYDTGISPTRGPIMLVHGLAVRGNVFNAPNETNLIHMLLDHGYDVWLNNWRASIDLDFNEYDLDQAAVYDHPAAVRRVVEETGSSQIKAVIHCQGSTSFMISLMNGLVPEVRAVVSNAVSLHPVVPRWSVLKLNVLLPILKPVLTHLDAQWARTAPGIVPRTLNGMAQLVHREPDTPVGRLTSFMFGSGFPAMWLLENLSPETKAWMQDEFGKVPMTFYTHIAKSVRAGQLVRMGRVEGLPERYADFQPKTDARFSLFAGRRNRTFLWQSQQQTFDFLDRFRPGYHSLHVLDDYSHLDVFMGKNAHRDVFPMMIQELDRTPLHRESESSAPPLPRPER